MPGFIFVVISELSIKQHVSVTVELESNSIRHVIMCEPCEINKITKEGWLWKRGIQLIFINTVMKLAFKIRIIVVNLRLDVQCL